MSHQGNPRVRGGREHPEFRHRKVFDEGRAEARLLRREGPTSPGKPVYLAGLSPEGLGLSPDLSRLPREVRDTIRLGDNGGHRSRDEARVTACAAMFRVGYGAAEIWAVMTDPLNGVSADFFEKRGDQADIALEQVIARAYEESACE